MDFTISPIDPRIFGGFLEHLGRAVYQGVYEPGSPHADADGCRTDVLTALKKLKFTAMRYPGGNFVSGYHWEDAVGPAKSRPVTRDLAWQSLESNQFGPDEFITLSRKMGWTPMMAVNLGTGTPEEARNWLEYCNIESGSKFAEMRRSNGYKKPHDVKLWCLGNEMDGPWQLGHVPAETYAVQAQQTANMMRMCDPSIELVVCGSCTTDLPTYLEWDRKVLEHCKDFVDFISVHRYVGNYGDDALDYFAVSNSIDAQIEATAAVCHAVQATKKTKKRIGISFDEWNVWYRANKPEHMDGRGKIAPHLLEEVYNMEDALVAASFLNSFIRHADSVKIANIAQIVNVIAPILTKGDDVLIQSIFYPIEMIANRFKGTALQSALVGPSYESKSHGKASFLDRSISVDGKNLHISLSNRSLEDEIEVLVDLGGATIVKFDGGEILHHSDPKAHNTFEKKDTVVSKPYSETHISDGKAIVKLPPLSVFAGTFSLE